MGVKTPKRRAIELVVVGVAYYAAARVGLLMQLPGTHASVVWPPSGVALAAVLAVGVEIWPAITVAAFLANLQMLPASPVGVAAALLTAVGNTVEPVIALSVIRRFCPSEDPFQRGRDALVFVGAALFSGLIAATCGAATLAVFDLAPAPLYGYGWLTRWVADLGGMVIVTPALYAWYRRPRLGLPPARIGELAALLALALLIGEMVFGGHVSTQLAASRPYLPLLFWVAFRFGQRETSTFTLVIATQAAAHTWLVMQGPASAPAAGVLGMLFVNVTSSPAEWLRALQLFLCGTSMVCCVVAAAVAERDESVRAMTESERRFRTIFEQAAVGVALIRTTSGEFTRVNERYCEIVGLTESELTAAALDAITHPDDRAAEREHMRRLAAGETTQFTMEARYQRRDGTTVWVSLTVSPTWKPGDAASHHVAIVKDITKQKEADRLFRATVDSAPIAMIMTTADGEIVIVNDEAESLFGHPRRALVGRPFDTLVPERFHDARIGSIPFATSPKKQRLGIDQDLYCRRSDGYEFPVELGVSPIATEQGTFILTAIVDMTARKELETGLLGVNHALEGWVLERTSQLESANRNLEAQVVERKRIETELRGALQEKETLLREIHHRVKNNLAVVSGLLYLESTNVRDEQTLRILEESQHRVRSMAMVHEKLYASGNLAAVNAREYFESLLDYLFQSYSTRAREVKISAHIDDALFDVETAVPCGLIFTELVTNSLKHAFPNGRTGSIAVEMCTRPGGDQLLTVKDDGVGLPEGMSVMHAPSLGWRLVRSLSRQLGAGLEVRDTHPGTETVLQFRTKVVH